MGYVVPLTVVSNIKCVGRRVGDYLYDKHSDTIFYQLDYPFPCKFAVKSLKHIYVTPMMNKMWSFLKYHNIDWLQKQLTQINCVEDDCLLIHGAAWEENGEGVLAVGFPNSGKTTIVLEKVSQGAKFCSDELVIIDRTLTATPLLANTSLSWHTAKKINYPLTFSQKLDFVFTKLRAKMFPIFEPNIWVELPYKRKRIKIDKIIYLTEGVNSLAILTDNEYPFYTNPVVQSYAYATGWDLDGVYRKYRRLLDVLSSNTQSFRKQH